MKLINCAVFAIFMATFLQASAEVGVVRSFSTEKGYGHIAIPCGGQLFVHISKVEESGLTELTKNQCVSFDIIPGQDGREFADNIEVIECAVVEQEAVSCLMD